MRPFRTEDVSSKEWRWVAIIAGFLVTLTLIPYAWAILASDDSWSFLGILANPQDGATYFAKIRQGIQGYWLFELRYTPEAHDSAGLFTFYLLLGHIARILGFSTVVIFHLTRVAASLFMFSALYQLGAHVWQRLRPRRLFFALTAVASGLGWLAIVLIPDRESLPPDLTVPEAFPLYAAYANPHFPLSIGCLALLAGILLQVFRPGFQEGPSASNGGLSIIVYAIILAIVQPPALVAIGVTLVIFIGINGYIRRIIPWHEIRWGSMLWLPVFPILVYYLLVFNNNEIMGQFNQQNITPSPNVLLTLVGYGLLAIVAVPGIVRAFRRFERDGDQFMVIWLFINLILLYIPFSLQRRFFIGLVIPLAYFAVRSLEDYWLYRIRTQWHRIALILIFVFMLPSNILVLGIPLIGAVANQEQGSDAGIVTTPSYIEIYNWLEEVGNEGEIVLAAPRVSLWIPARTNLSVVYGHPFETINAEKREQQVEDFYSGRDCTTLFTEQDFRISYIIVGSQELEIAEEAIENNPEEKFSDCVAEIIENQEITEDQIREFGDMILYTLRPLR